MLVSACHEYVKHALRICTSRVPKTQMKRHNIQSDVRTYIMNFVTDITPYHLLCRHFMLRNTSRAILQLHIDRDLQNQDCLLKPSYLNTTLHIFAKIPSKHRLHETSPSLTMIHNYQLQWSFFNQIPYIDQIKLLISL